ncbi:hypothetical protein [Thalassovita sp.]|nr:hypothetical protein [Thalassovita sp.]
MRWNRALVNMAHAPRALQKHYERGVWLIFAAVRPLRRELRPS